MSRAQKLRQNKKHDGDEIPDYETYDFSQMTEKDPLKACMLLKFGRKGHAHETIVRLSEDKTYVEWDGRWLTRKKKEDRRVYLEQASRVQAGQKTVPFERLKHHFGEAEKNSFSIIYGNGRSLDLIAPTPDMYMIWYYGLQSIMKHIQDLHENMDMDRRFLKEKFDTADKNRVGHVTRKDVQKMLTSMNIPIPAKVVHQIFKDVNRDKSGKMSFDEFTEFMNQLRRRPELEVIWDIMTIVSAENEAKLLGSVQPLSFFGFKEDYEFRNRALPVTLDRLRQFWEGLQGELLEKEQASDMIVHVTPNVFYGNEPVLSYVGWVNLITQPENDAYDPEKRKFNLSNMHHPLSHYYIASSHNTYLTGDQIRSNSSVNRYIDDLCKNCRCVELDCWDGDTEDQEPVITHGNTLCTKIKFEDVVIAIKNYAFKTTSYPLVLSIENHCSMQQQEKMAQMFIYEFGSMLLHPDEFKYDDLKPGDPGLLPTPEQLRKRIILKGKVCKKGDQDDEDEDSDEEDEDEATTTDGSSTTGSRRNLRQQDSSASLGSSSASFRTGSSAMSLTSEDDDDDNRSEFSDDTRSEYSDDTRSENDVSETSSDRSGSVRRLQSASGSFNKSGKKGSHRRLNSRRGSSSSGFSDSSSSMDSAGVKKKEKKKGTHPALSAITFLGTTKHKSFKNSDDTPCNLMSSFGESKTLKYLDKKKTLNEWLLHNTSHVSRIYPKGARVDSSNLDPTPAWAAGNHMVALNYQTPGESMQLNDAKFLENGNCGYVLKPEYMLDLTRDPTRPYILTVHVISGQQLPKVSTKIMTEVQDPFVQVSVHGVPADSKLVRTAAVKNNGFNPVWDQVFEFKIRSPDVAQLMLRVYDEDNTPKNASEFIAYASIPLPCLRLGIRSVSLYDEKSERKGDYAFASLVIRTKVSEWTNWEAEIQEEEKEKSRHRHHKKKDDDEGTKIDKKGLSGSVRSFMPGTSTSSSQMSTTLDDSDDVPIDTSAHFIPMVSQQYISVIGEDPGVQPEK